MLEVISEPVTGRKGDCLIREWIQVMKPDLSRKSANRSAADQHVPCGSGGAKDFRKVASGAPAKVSGSPQRTCGRFGGTAGVERGGRYYPELEFFQGQIFARRELQAQASATSGRECKNTNALLLNPVLSSDRLNMTEASSASTIGQSSGQGLVLFTGQCTQHPKTR